jgi:preprotein translocase subunit SecG
MLYTLLLIVLVVVSLVLVAAILLQAGKGGGVAASFGGASSSADAFIGTRQAGNLLTKASWWCGGIFLALAFVLQIASTRNRTPRSVLDQPLAQPPASTPAPKGAAPAVPLEPATPGAQSAPAPANPAPATPAPAPKP